MLGKPYAGKPHVRIDEGEGGSGTANETFRPLPPDSLSTLLAKSFGVSKPS